MSISINIQNLVKFFQFVLKILSGIEIMMDRMTANPNSLISRTDKVELIATEFFQQSCDCLGYLKQHTKSCKTYLVGKYIYF